MTIRSLFPTELYTGSLDDPDLIAELEGAVWMLEDGDTAGRAWCEEHGYDGYTSYASLDDLPQRASAFATLKTKLDAHAARYAEALQWDLSAQTLQLDALWVNILGEGGSHSGHIHPTSVISGTVYIAMPDGAGALKFEDPRLTMMMAAPPTREGADDAHRRFVYVTPPVGTLLMWESWLRHEVMPNRSEDPRLSISFNYGLVATD